MHPPAAGRVPTFSGGMRDIEPVAWDEAQMHHLDQSMAFAAILEERSATASRSDRRPSIARRLACSNRPTMPAVLVEMGFLTNPDQEKRLTGNEFQNAFVQARRRPSSGSGTRSPVNNEAAGDVRG